MQSSQVRQIINTNNEVLLKQMSELISCHVGSLKRSAEDSDSFIREIKKIKTVDTRPVFKKKSSEEQHISTKKILESLEGARYTVRK